jgi:transposase InsO family protein
MNCAATALSLRRYEENLQLMRLLDEQYTRTPCYGVLRMTAWLQRQGYAVNEKRVRRFLRTMGLMAIYPNLKTSQPAPSHRIYPYLLRGVTITRPNFVWSTDITSIRLAHGFVYLVAIMDWYSRYVLAWRLSNSLETHFCVEALEHALASATPHIFTTDQGAQFTSVEFTRRLDRRAVRISMDGRGRALDNVNALAPVALGELGVGGGLPQLLSIRPRRLARTQSLFRLLQSRATSVLLWDISPQQKCTVVYGHQHPTSLVACFT